MSKKSANISVTDNEKILLVDSLDKELGFEDKLIVHRKGLLHRSFSILIFNSKHELLIQRRDLNKYHSGELWSNSCCSHQRKDESLQEAIHRRLREEMGFDCFLKEVSSFKYQTKFDNGLVENELDHVFLGLFDGAPIVNKSEVMDFKWISLDCLEQDVKNNPELYSYWFREIVNKSLLEIRKFL